MFIKLTTFNMTHGVHIIQLINPEAIKMVSEVAAKDKRNPDANTSVYVDGYGDISVKESLEQIALATEVAFKQRKEA